MSTNPVGILDINPRAELGESDTNEKTHAIPEIPSEWLQLANGSGLIFSFNYDFASNIAFIQ